MEKQRLFVDMDGTLARFHDQANYLERMFEKDFFRNLEPFENMVEGIRLFTRQFPEVEVCILSAKVIGEPPYCEMEKHAWMDEHLPEIPRERRYFTDMGRPKAEFIPGGITKSDFLLDDYNKGLNQWLFDGGSAIKCHNNINQMGLGSHGGQAGHLWVGPMAHTSDKPEMIAAELASHMGLSYDLNQVVSAYPEISLGESQDHVKKLIPRGDGRDGYYAIDKELHFWGAGAPKQNPLNAIRYLDGKSDFDEVRLDTGGRRFSVPIFQLRDICSNVYHTNDYQKLLKNHPWALAASVESAIENASLPIVGHVDYLSGVGVVRESRDFHRVEDMRNEIRECKEAGTPIDITWNISPLAQSLSAMTREELEDKFFYEYDMSGEKAAYLAGALDKPSSERTEDETLDLTQFWHEANPPVKESLYEFLRVDPQEFLAPELPVGPKQEMSTDVKPGLDAIIQRAFQVKQTGSSPQQNHKGPSESR